MRVTGITRRAYLPALQYWLQKCSKLLLQVPCSHMLSQVSLQDVHRQILGARYDMQRPVTFGQQLQTLLALD